MVPTTENTGAKPPTQSRTIILFVLGIILLAPMLWTRLGPAMGNLAAITATAPPEATSSTSTSSEDAAERMLLQGASLAQLPEPRRPCRSGGKLPKLITLQQWISTKQRPRESITLMTQLSADRLAMLENQCRTWPDPIIAAVYVPLFRDRDGGPPTVATYQNTTMDDIIRGINSFHTFMEGTAQCALRIELVGQYISRRNPQQYPINALRNKALSLANTDLVLMLDVDFVASPQLGLPEPGYRDPAVYNQMVELTNKKKAIVLPAFEITNRKQDLTMAQNFARSMVVAGKETVQQHYKEGMVDAFNGRDAPWGHGPSNTTKWVRLSRPILYRVVYEPKYEPFVILSRHQAPWADERFVGYGGNKIAYINQLNGLGFGFHVHPYGFAIHVPHVRTRAANLFVLHKHRGLAEMEELRLEVEAQIKKKTYVPVIQGCKPQLEEEEEYEEEQGVGVGVDGEGEPVGVDAEYDDYDEEEEGEGDLGGDGGVENETDPSSEEGGEDEYENAREVVDDEEVEDEVSIDEKEKTSASAAKEEVEENEERSSSGGGGKGSGSNKNNKLSKAGADGKEGEEDADA